jgi:fluoroacetyl-CoA thioesterase
MKELIPNSAASAELTVKPTDLASALPLTVTDAFPEVFATSRMIALMEIAAARLMQPLLAEGELSVGVSISASHTAPTPVGAKITATAHYTGMDDRLFCFDVVVIDAGGEVGRAIHQRAIVDAGRLQAKAENRVNPIQP